MPRPASRRAGGGELTVRRPDPEVWRAALRLADGDHRRLSTQSDGTVLVHNRPVR